MVLGVVGYPDTDDEDDSAYPDTDAQYGASHSDTVAEGDQGDHAYPDARAPDDGAYPDTDAQYDDAYPDTDAQYDEHQGAYPDTDAQYDGAYPDTDAQYDSAYPDTDAQYDSAYPDTDAQYNSVHPRTAAQLDAPPAHLHSVTQPDRVMPDPEAAAGAAARPCASASGPARSAPSLFAKGDAVWYTDGAGDEHEAEVVHVDHEARVEGEDAAYTVKLLHQAGREKNTISERLRSRQGGNGRGQGVAGGASAHSASPAAIPEAPGAAAARPAAPPPSSSTPGRWRPPEWAKPALLHKPVLEMHTPDRPVPKQKPIGKRPVTIIGRNGQVSDVVIEEPSLSRAHAAVINSSSATFLQDMHSAHGTWYDAEGRLNPVPQLGQRLDPSEPPVKLVEGGTFRLGSSTKVFRVTGITVDAVQRWQPPPWAEQPTINCFFEIRSNSFANPYLAHRYDDNGGDVDEELAMSSSCLLIGRSTQLCDSVIRHESISRQHAAFLHAEGVTYVQDLGTPSGTILNDKRIPPNKEMRMRDGDVVSFGESKATYTYRQPLKAVSAQKRKR